MAIRNQIEIGTLEPLFGFRSNSGNPLVISGPCSAESRSQVLSTANDLAAAGVRVFRAGVWKPRTRPGSFEGVGSRALSWLSAVRKETGMIPMTEVATQSHLRAALRAGIDAFWIGARTAANPFAVQEIADLLSELPAELRDSLTFLVKNPVNPDLELWIGALQRIYDAGIHRLGAIHRGFSAYGEHIYRNVPEWRIPIELMRRIPGLPVLCDPSHIGGSRDLVLPISKQSLDMDFDGLFIESHSNPENALSDAAQQITPSELAALLHEVGKGPLAGSDCGLKVFRDEIDEIDDSIISLLARRMSVAREIGEYKHREKLSVVQLDRYRSLMEKRVTEGAALGLSEKFLREVLGSIHQESVRQQLEGNANK